MQIGQVVVVGLLMAAAGVEPEKLARGKAHNMQTTNTRRKRRRKPTMNGRFGPASMALEIGLLRMTIDTQREIDKIEGKNERK